MAGWYAVRPLAPGLTAIGEPRYHQQNWSYLIEGRDRALLFDTGSFMGNIAPVVAGLTEKPLRVLPSHMHYDHLGNIHRFDDICLPDLDVLRACARDGVVTPTDELFLPQSEGRVAPSFAVADWLPIGARIDLGGIELGLVHTPGHSPDSVSLWWTEAQVLLAADFLYHGPLFAQVPGASLSDYLATARDLQGRLGDDTVIFGAHGDADDPETATAPTLGTVHLEALVACLEAIRRAPPDLETGTAEVTVSPEITLVLNVAALKGFA